MHEIKPIAQWRPHPPPPARRSISIIVLWMLLLMSLLAAFHRPPRTPDLDCRNGVESARARACRRWHRPRRAGARRKQPGLALARRQRTLSLGIQRRHRHESDGRRRRQDRPQRRALEIIESPVPLRQALSLPRPDLAEPCDRPPGAAAAQPADDDRATIDRALTFAGIDDLGALPGAADRTPLLHAVPLVTVHTAWQRSIARDARRFCCRCPCRSGGDRRLPRGARAAGRGRRRALPPPVSIARYLAPTAISAVTIRAAAAISTARSLRPQAPFRCVTRGTPCRSGAGHRPSSRNSDAAARSGVRWRT